MSMNNAIVIEEIPIRDICAKASSVCYEVFEVPCVDNDDMVFLKSHRNLRDAIVYALKQDFEYGIIFKGFDE